MREDLQQLSVDLDLGKHHAMSSLLEQRVNLRMMGGVAIRDSALLRDEALTAFFNWEAIAHSTTIGRRLPEMRCWHHLV